jgi:hypothetical protein
LFEDLGDTDEVFRDDGKRRSAARCRRILRRKSRMVMAVDSVRTAPGKQMEALAVFYSLRTQYMRIMAG